MPVETGVGAYVLNLGAVGVVGTLFGMPIEAFYEAMGVLGVKKWLRFLMYGAVGCLAVASMKQKGGVMFDRHHCRDAFMSERENLHLPPEFREYK